ncbi:hypothetical protein NMY22_g8345 [Coprinellus aureogranulatus]|nr:hypothetical protein NMY22_g8345 [Coprinellus aureogranulatus]
MDAFESLWTLKELLSPECFPEEAIELAFRHLKPELPREQLSQALVFISRARKACSSNPRLKRFFVPRFIQDVQGFCLWSTFLFEDGILSTADGSISCRDIRNVYLAQAESLLSLMTLDKLVLEALVSENAFLKLLGRLWVGEDPDGDVVMSNENDDKHAPFCPIVLCMVNVVFNTVGRERMMETFRTGGYGTQRRFVGALVKRIRMLPVCVGPRELENIRTLSQIVDHLIRRDPLLHYSLTKAGYFRKACEALGALFQTLISHPEFNEMGRIFVDPLIETIFNLFRTLAYFPTHIAQRCRDALAAGVLPLLTHIITFVPPNDNESPVSFNIVMEVIGWHMYYPIVFRQLMTAQPPLEVESKLLNMQMIKDAWKEFKIAFQLWEKTFRGIPFGPIELCDNPSCDWKNQDKRRECGGCSSVIYCSSECQRQDWEERHRDECPHARVNNSSTSR